MVAVIIIAILFTAFAVSVAYLASKGAFKGLAGRFQGTGRTGTRLLNVTLVIVYIGCGIGLPLIFIIGNNAKSNAQVGGIKLTAGMQVGRELFAEHCGVCHTLAADNSVGKMGPDLDTLRPSKSLILHTIANGCLQNSTRPNTTCLGYGTMPADIVEGQEAQDVADFVSRIAGHT